MPYLPQIPETQSYQQIIDVFQGYNHNLKIADGQFYDMQNLTSSYYPLLSNRDKRGIFKSLNYVVGMLAKTKLCYVDIPVDHYENSVPAVHKEVTGTEGTASVSLPYGIKDSLIVPDISFAGDELVSDITFSIGSNQVTLALPGEFYGGYTDIAEGIFYETQDADGVLPEPILHTIEDAENIRVKAVEGTNTLTADMEGSTVSAAYYCSDLTELGAKIYYGDSDWTDYLTAGGYYISSAPDMLPKQLASMGAYILIFPDKLYINTEHYWDCGKIEAEFTSAGSVSYQICRNDGSTYSATPTVSSTEPSNPANGDLWIDTSGEIHALKQWSSVNSMWVSMATVYTKISNANIGKQFSKLDGVDISGASAPSDASDDIKKQIRELNGTKIIYAKGDDYIVVVGLLDNVVTQTEGTLTVSRKMPDMDYITEAENRLWGCKYGWVNDQALNEIYCCALGDFKNWRQYLGLSTDSYTASVGTDGPWTGAITHLGYPLFFKENCMHKVYISSSGAHQIVDMACRGVQDGSSKSLVVVNETLFYKGRTDILAYDGSLPQSVSAALGVDKFYDAVAGRNGDKYYISMRDKQNEWSLFAYDSSKGLWHKEDQTHVTFFADCEDDLFFTQTDSNKLFCVNGSKGSKEDDFKWSATTGIMGISTFNTYASGYDFVDQKYISRFNIRMKLPPGSDADLFMEYDSDGVWHHQGHIEGTGTNTFMLPVRPRRCDHFRFRIEGTGDVKIYSLAKIHESGSDVT